MCGISGYIGKREAVQIVLEGIHKLEYRGYDSAGIATIVDGKLHVDKQVGKVSALEEHLTQQTNPGHVAIAHTRWATHGKPSTENAHPQVDQANQVAVVHNGIIENHEQVHTQLAKQGVKFRSETDTEVISQLIASLYEGDLLQAVKKAIPLLQGAFAIAVIHEKHPDQIVCAAKESPLAIGEGDGEMFVASDSQAFLKYTRNVIFLHSSEVALITKEGVQAFDAASMPIPKKSQEIGHETEDASKGEYSHYMLKEIFEQPQTLQNALLSRYSEKYGTAILDQLKLKERKVKRIVILACGTSYHAGMVAGYMLEDLARIPVEVEVSSEFRYRNPIVQDHTMVIAISQSGETADTLAAMRELKEKGADILGICNVQNSTLARETEHCLFLRAGPEIGVASTKAFTSQLVVLTLLALKLARHGQMSQAEGQEMIAHLMALPAQAKQVLAQYETIKKIAKKYAHYDNFFYLGRRYMFPTALEGALKLKEIAYVNANGYAAGEMKHGPIALISPDCPTVACLGDSVTHAKMLSNLREVKAREGLLISIAPEGMDPGIADDVITIPKTCDELSPILTTIATQLLAYEIASQRNCEIDQPRNLAKSVTVE